MSPSTPPSSRSHRAWSALYALEHFAGPGALADLAKGWRESLPDRATDAPASFEPVPRVRDASRRELLERFVKPGLPVVLEGAASHWPAVKKWSPDWFAERFGDHPVRLMNAGVEDFADPQGWRPIGRTVHLRDVIRSIASGTGEYSRFLPLLHDFPELAADFDEAWLAGLRDRVAGGRNYQLFIGGPGSNTALHNAMGSNLFVEVYGEKEWRIASTRWTPRFAPEMARSPYFFSGVDLEDPDLTGVTGWTTVLRPGDVLYNPPFYWHQVRNHTATIGVGFRYYAPGAILRSSKTLALLTLAARNPPIWTAVQEKKDFTRVFARAR
ncbi:MAG: cupin-like domain-containing protein [Alphaproteobacteria bacterium]|nr:cupin-like domain-containing protein [Alphaproteobacteria bacterium]